MAQEIQTDQNRPDARNKKSTRKRARVSVHHQRGADEWRGARLKRPASRATKERRSEFAV